MPKGLNPTFTTESLGYLSRLILSTQHRRKRLLQ